MTKLLVTVLDDHEPDPAPVSLVYPGQGLLPHELRVSESDAD